MKTKTTRIMLLSAFLALCMIISVFNFAFLTAAESLGPGPTPSVLRAADKDTTDSYRDRLLSDEWGARYAGRLWADKSVFASYDEHEIASINLDMKTDGYNGTVSANADFLHVFSTLSSSQMLRESTPVDLVIVIDISMSMTTGLDTNNVPGSQNKTRIYETAKAIEDAFESLMEYNSDSRISIIGYGGNYTTLLPLGRYDSITVDSYSVDYDITMGGGLFALRVAGDYQNDDDDDEDVVTKLINYPNNNSWNTANSDTRRNTLYNGGKPWNEFFSGNSPAAYSNDVIFIQNNTNLSSGIYRGLKTLVDETETKTETGKTRTPAVIIMTDGGANRSLKEYWYNPPQNNETNPTNGTEESQFTKATSKSEGDSASIILHALLTASYMKSAVEANYGTDAFVYTVGMDLFIGSTDNDEIEKEIGNDPGTILYESRLLSTLNPAEYFLVGGEDDRLGLETKLNAELMLDYNWYPNFQYYTDNVYDAAWTVGTGNPGTNGNPNAVGSPSTHQNKTPEDQAWRDQYRTAKYTNSILDAYDAWILWKTGNKEGYMSDNISVDGSGTVKVNGILTKYQSRAATVDDSEFTRYFQQLPTTYSANGGDDSLYRPSGATWTVTKDDIIKNIAYSDGFFRNSEQNNMSQIFQNIVNLLNSDVFTPVAGSNSLDVEDSVIYMDPIGDYMEIKNGAVTTDEGTGEMAVLLFGNMHKLGRSGMYDYDFSSAYRTAHGGLQVIPNGWYNSNDGATAVLVAEDPNLPTGCSTAADAWAKGYFRYLDYKKAIEFVPTLDTVSGPDALPDKQKNTDYTFYTFNSADEYALWRLNPAYAGKVKELSANDYDPNTFVMSERLQNAYNGGTDVPDGVYRLSDIRVWVEDTGDYKDENPGAEDGSGLFAGLGYDQALYVNIPASAIPLQVAEVAVDINNEVQYYVTNLGDDHNGEISYYRQSTPLRLFYAVGIQDKILTDDGTGIGLAKVKSSYTDKHRGAANGVYFLSNYWTAGETDDGNTEQGDPVITFSPSKDNYYYVFQYPRAIYTQAYQWNGSKFEAINAADKAAEDWGGSELKGTYESTVEAERVGGFSNGDIIFVTSDAQRKGIQTNDSNYYFIAVEYYQSTGNKVTLEGVPEGATTGRKVRFVLVRSGQQLIGGGYNDIHRRDMLCWLDIDDPGNMKDYDPDDMNGYGKPNGDNWVLATKPGALRVNDLYTYDKDVNGNLTNTATKTYLPVVSNSSESGSGNDFKINAYLGNNGYLYVADTILMVTKLVGAEGKVEGEAANTLYNEEFNYQVYIEGYTGTRKVIKLEWDENSKLWRRRISIIDVVTDNDGLLQKDPNTLAEVNHNGKDCYIYVPDGDSTNSGQNISRVYSSPENETGNAVGKMELSEDKRTTLFPTDVYLISKTDYENGDWKYSDGIPVKGERVEKFVIAKMEIVDNDGHISVNLNSDYLIQSEYLTETLTFGIDESELYDDRSFTINDVTHDKAAFAFHTTEFTLKSGEGLLFNTIQLGGDYRVTEKLTDEQVANNWSLWPSNQKLKSENEKKGEISNIMNTLHVAVRHIRNNLFTNYDSNGEPTDVWSNDDGGSIWEKNDDNYINPENGEPLRITTQFDTVNHVYSVYGDTSEQEEGVQYVNTVLLKPVAIDLTAIKEVTGDYIPTLQEGDYAFSITPEKGNPDDDPIKKTTVRNEAPDPTNSARAAIMLIENATYSGIDEYVYTVTEVVPEQKIPGITYSEIVYTVTVSVTGDYSSGILTADVTVSTDGTTPGRMNIIPTTHTTEAADGTDHERFNIGTFENKFSTDTAIVLSGTKILTATPIGSAILTAGQFTFVLTGVSATYTDGGEVNPTTPPMPNGEQVTAITTNNANGTFSFDEITFTRLGTYTYKIKETAGTAIGYTYDTTEYTVTVTVTRDTDIGMLNAKVTSIDGGGAVVFNNLYNQPVNLTISKTVTGSRGDKNKAFTCTATLTPPQGVTLAGSYRYTLTNPDTDQGQAGSGNAELTANNEGGYTVQINGGNIALKHNQSITIHDLPVGTRYIVNEADYSEDGYGTMVNGKQGRTTNGTLTADTNVHFVNSNPVSGVYMSKTVTGTNADLTKEFTFTVTLTDANGKPLEGEYTYTGSKTGTIAGGSAKITLAHNESIQIEDLPKGTKVSVTEEPIDDYHMTVSALNGTAIEHGVTVTVPDEVEGQQQRVSIDFTNHRDMSSPELGDLMVEKTVTGSTGDTKKDFNFSVELSDTGINGIYGDMTFVNGVAEFTLKHNESKFATGLPAGTTYKVIETQANQDGYTTTATGNIGTIPTNGTAKAEFVNNKSDNLPDPPKTGDDSHIDMWIALMFSSLICVAVCLFSMKKKKFST